MQERSSESKELDKPGIESDEEQLVREHAKDRSPRLGIARGWPLTLFSNSLAATMGPMFVLSWLVQSSTGHAAYNE